MKTEKRNNQINRLMVLKRDLYRTDYASQDVKGGIKDMKKIWKSCEGQSLVEFALILPVFLLILFGIIEFGRLWEISNIATSAAREGARVAAIADNTLAQGSAAAQNVLSAGNVSNANVSVLGPNGAQEITVTVVVNYTPVSGTIIPGLGNMTITRSTTMHWEG